MKKNLLLSILCLLIFSTVVYSQMGYKDVVYLKNGGKVIGIIVEQIPNFSIKIETSNGSVMVFKMDEIEKIVKEKTTNQSIEQPVEQKFNVPPPPPQQQPTRTEFQNQTFSKFLSNGLSASFAVGIHNVEPTSTINKIDGNEFEGIEYEPFSGTVFIAQVVSQQENFALLFGGAVDKYANGVFSTFYVGGQFYFNVDKFSPFVFLKGGYGMGDLENPFDSNEEIKFSGPYFSAGVGSKYYLGNSWGLYAEGGFKYQGSSAEWEVKDSYDRTYKIESDQKISGFQFLVGIFFYP